MPAVASPSPTVAPPPGHPRFARIDAIRAVAALLIVAYHVAYISGSLSYGWMRHATVHLNVGVPIFFSISGFVLYRPFVAQRHGAPARSTGAYAVNRFLRIVPAYWVALTVSAIYPTLIGVFTGDWWRYYGFAQVYNSRTEVLGLAVAWTLCIELTFYALLPLYAAAMTRVAGTRRHWQRVELGVLLALSAASVVAAAEIREVTLLSTFTWFAPGMAMAVLSVRGARVPLPDGWRLAAWPLAVVVYVAFCAVNSESNPLGLQGVAFYAADRLFAVVIAALVIAPAVFRADPGSPGNALMRRLGWLGLVSYGLFLYHLPVLAAVQRLGFDDVVPGRTAFSYALLGIPVSVAIAALSFYALERPLMRLGARLHSRG